MTAFLIDEMFFADVAERLRTKGHDAVHVSQIGLGATDDAAVAAAARRDGRCIVTENVADFANERDVVLVFVLKKKLPTGRTQAGAAAKALDRWARSNADPYVGHHWPRVG